MTTTTEYRYEDGEPVPESEDYWTAAGYKRRSHYHRYREDIGFNYLDGELRLDAVIADSGQRCHISGVFVPRDIAECDHVKPMCQAHTMRFPDGAMVLFNDDGTRCHTLDNIRIVHPDAHLVKSRGEIADWQRRVYERGAHVSQTDAHKLRTSKLAKHLATEGRLHLQTDRGRRESSARAKDRNRWNNPKYTPESYGLTVAIQKLYGTGNHTQKEVADMLGCGQASITLAIRRDPADYAVKCGVDLGEQNDKVARIEFSADDERSTGGLRVQSDATDYASV